MGKESLKKHAELLIDAIRLVGEAEMNLANIESMSYYYDFKQMKERAHDIVEARLLLDSACASLKRQTKYVTLEITELKL